MIDMLKEIGQLPPGYGDSAVNQLPRPAGLLGRDEALHNVVKTLKYERLVIIVGGPGEGKSVLAAAAAHSMSDDKLLPGGAFAVDLATATTDGELWRIHVARCMYKKCGSAQMFLPQCNWL